VAHFLRRSGWISVVGTPPEARGEGSSGVASRGVPESKHRGVPLKARFRVLNLVSRLVSYLRKYSKKYLRPRLVSMAPPAESLRASFSKGWAESCKARVCGRSYDPNDFRTGLLSGSIDVYGRSQGPKLWSLAGLRQKV
jgi:hypothetical protein